MGSESVSRIYVGNLPMSVDERDVEREFRKFGNVLKCDLKKTISGAPFAFIEFDDPRDAADAIKERDGFDFEGNRLRVEIPFNARSGGNGGRRTAGGREGIGRREPPRKGRYVVHISGLPLSGSWQDIKDHMRDAGECGHADSFHDGTGEISFFSKRDAQNAVMKFDGSVFTSHEGEKSRITVQEKDMSDDKGGDRSGGGMRYRSPSYGDDRYNGRRMRDSPSYGRSAGCDRYNDKRYGSRGRSSSRSRSVSDSREKDRRDRRDRERKDERKGYRRRYSKSSSRGGGGGYMRGRGRRSRSRSRSENRRDRR